MSDTDDVHKIAFEIAVGVERDYMDNLAMAVTELRLAFPDDKLTYNEAMDLILQNMWTDE